MNSVITTSRVPTKSTVSFIEIEECHTEGYSDVVEGFPSSLGVI